MARREVENTPGDVISPATDVTDEVPGASEDPVILSVNEAEHVVQATLDGVEEKLGNARGRQTLTGAVLVANAITFAGILIARAIRASK